MGEAAIHEQVRERQNGREWIKSLPQDQVLTMVGCNRAEVLGSGQTGLPHLALNITRDLLEGTARTSGKKQIADLVRNALTQATVPITASTQEMIEKGLARLKNIPTQDFSEKVKRFWHGTETMPGYVDRPLMSGKGGGFTGSVLWPVPMPEKADGKLASNEKQTEIILEDTARSAYTLCSILHAEGKINQENGWVYVARPNGEAGGEVFRVVRTDESLVGIGEFLAAVKQTFQEWEKEEKKPEPVRQMHKTIYGKLLEAMGSDRIREKAKREGKLLSELVMEEWVGEKWRENIKSLNNLFIRYIQPLEKLVQNVAVAVYFDPESEEHGVVRHDIPWGVGYVTALRRYKGRMEVTPAHPHMHGGNMRTLLRKLQRETAETYRNKWEETGESCERQEITLPPLVMQMLGSGEEIGIFKKWRGGEGEENMTERGMRVRNGKEQVERQTVSTAVTTVEVSPQEIQTLREKCIAAGNLLFDEWKMGEEKMSAMIRRNIRTAMENSSGWEELGEREKVRRVEEAYAGLCEEIFSPRPSTVGLLLAKVIAEESECMLLSVLNRKDMPDELTPFCIWSESEVFQKDETGNIIGVDYRAAASMQFRNWREIQIGSQSGLTHPTVLSVGADNTFNRRATELMGGIPARAVKMVEGPGAVFISQMRDPREEKAGIADESEKIGAIVGSPVDIGDIEFFTVGGRSPWNVGVWEQNGKYTVCIKENYDYPQARQRVVRYLLSMMERKEGEGAAGEREEQRTQVEEVLTQGDTGQDNQEKMTQTMHETLAKTIGRITQMEKTGVPVDEEGKTREELEEIIGKLQEGVARMQKTEEEQKRMKELLTKNPIGLAVELAAYVQNPEKLQALIKTMVGLPRGTDTLAWFLSQDETLMQNLLTNPAAIALIRKNFQKWTRERIGNACQALKQTKTEAKEEEK